MSSYKRFQHTKANKEIVTVEQDIDGFRASTINLKRTKISNQATLKAYPFGNQQKIKNFMISLSLVTIL